MLLLAKSCFFIRQRFSPPSLIRCLFFPPSLLIAVWYIAMLGLVLAVLVLLHYPLPLSYSSLPLMNLLYIRYSLFLLFHCL